MPTSDPVGPASLTSGVDVRSRLHRDPPGLRVVQSPVDGAVSGREAVSVRSRLH